MYLSPSSRSDGSRGECRACVVLLRMECPYVPLWCRCYGQGTDVSPYRGETICTRSYLSESLGIKDSMAKSSTDSLKRTGAIAVKQEVISKDINNAKNCVSRVAVNGIPTPNEPYVKMYFLLTLLISGQLLILLSSIHIWYAMLGMRILGLWVLVAMPSKLLLEISCSRMRK